MLDLFNKSKASVVETANASMLGLDDLRATSFSSTSFGTTTFSLIGMVHLLGGFLNTSIRSDVVLFVLPLQLQQQGFLALHALSKQFDYLRERINQASHKFDSSKQPKSSRIPQLVRSEFMIACYPGNGTQYLPHLDAAPGHEASQVKHAV